jgi:hypothetical protein
VSEITHRRRDFKRSLFGYRRSAVDRYVTEVEGARSSLEGEVERLRPAERLSRVGDDVATLLTTFAETVSTLRDRTTAESEQVRRDADAYADERRAEADRVLHEARRSAGAAAAELVREARAELASIAEYQVTIVEALDRAAEGITASKQALSHLSRPAPPDPVVILPAPEPEASWPSAAAQ